MSVLCVGVGVTEGVCVLHIVVVVACVKHAVPAVCLCA